MRIVVVNPNSTVGMTERIGAAARQAAGANVEIAALNPADSPASIEGYYDEALSVPPMLRTMADNESGADAFVIACFDDTGLEAARCAMQAPVIGIGEAAFHCAALIAHRFSVVTTMKRSIAPIEANLVKYGLDRRCARVRACDIRVLDLERPGSGAREKLSAEIGRAKQEDDCDAIVLGCAGMADLAAALSKDHGLPVLDGVAAAVRLAEALAGLGLATSKSGPYASPLAK